MQHKGGRGAAGQGTMHMYFQAERANRILADYYERAVGELGREVADHGLKTIIAKGIDILLARPQDSHSGEALAVINAVRSGRQDLVMQQISADAKEMVKARRGGFVTTFKAAGQPRSFPPDVEVPVASQPRWQAFLDTLDKRCLRGEDPVTKLRDRIPFRDGVWNQDIMPAMGKNCVVPDEVEVVNGSLYLAARTARSSHPLEVRGSLYVDMSQLRGQRSMVSAVKGDVRLYDKSSRLATDLTCPPAPMLDWGIREETFIILNDRMHYRFHSEEYDGETYYALYECPRRTCLLGLSMRYLWNGEAWVKHKRELPPELVYAIRKKFARMCAILGIGDDFVLGGDDPVHEINQNFSRFVVLFKLFRGEHTPKAKRGLSEADDKALARMEQTLEDIRVLAVGEGAGLFEDMKLVEKQVYELLDEITEPRLEQSLAIVQGSHRPINVAAVGRDKAYLEMLLSGELEFGALLGTASKTIVFLNNFFVSKQAKSLAADKITPLREALARIVGQKKARGLVIDLLKNVQPTVAERLRRGGKVGDRLLTELEDKLEAFNRTPPMELIRDFRINDYGDATPELERDVEFLARCSLFKPGPIQKMFVSAEEPVSDTAIFKYVLLVSLQSFVADEVRRASYEFDPSEIRETVEGLLDRLNLYEPVIRVYNRMGTKPEGGSGTVINID